MKRIEKVVFVNAKNPKNTGDMFSSPYLYFKKYFDKFDVYHVDIADFEEYNPPELSKQDVVIFGGGALMDWHTVWNKRINDLSKRCKSVFWGVGLNENNQLEIEENIDFSNIDLIGLRDYDAINYVPCSSCLLPLEIEFPIKREVGAFLHYEGTNSKFNHLDSISNSAPVEDIIKFIGESEKILTNSFHGCYWSQLMGKKVVKINSMDGIDKHSSSVRFDKMKHVPIFRNENDFKGCEVYPDFLEESRKLNIDFFKQIQEFMQK